MAPVTSVGVEPPGLESLMDLSDGASVFSDARHREAIPCFHPHAEVPRCQTNNFLEELHGKPTASERVPLGGRRPTGVIYGMMLWLCS